MEEGNGARGSKLVEGTLSLNNSYQALLLDKLKLIMKMQAQFSGEETYAKNKIRTLDYFAGADKVKPKPNAEMVLASSMQMPSSFQPRNWSLHELEVCF